MNRSLITNLCALILAIVAYYSEQAIIFTMSVFALSGALTNWLAVWGGLFGALIGLASALSGII